MLFIQYHQELSKGAIRLAQWSVDYCDAILSVLSNLNERNKLVRRPDAVQRIHEGLKDLGLLLRYLETSSEDQTPTVFTKQLEKAIKKISPRDTLIVRPNNAYAFKATMLCYRLEDILTNL